MTAILREGSGWPLPGDVRLAWCEWLRRHGIDPMVVSIHGPIEVDVDAHRISYLAYDLDEHGNKYAAPDGMAAAQSERTVRFGTPLAPLPEVLARRLTTQP